MTKLLILNGVLISQLSLLPFARMVDLNFGIFLIIKGSWEKKYVGSYLHSQVEKQKEISSKNNG